MTAMTVREIRTSLARLHEQDAPLLVWASHAGETVPHVIDTGETRVLAASWDAERIAYVLVHNRERRGSLTRRGARDTG